MAQADRHELRDAILALRTGLMELWSLIETHSRENGEELSQPRRQPSRGSNCRLGTLTESPRESVMERDDLYDEALKVVTEFGHASGSVLQLWLSIGEARAARILSEMERDGLITPARKGREYKVLATAYSLRELSEMTAGSPSNQQKSCL